MSQERTDRTQSGPKPNRVRKHVSTTARPAVTRGLTFWMFLPAVAIVVAATLNCCLGRLSLRVLWSILVPSYYFLAMCVHDAIHRAAHANSYLNKAVGWIGSNRSIRECVSLGRAQSSKSESAALTATDS